MDDAIDEIPVNSAQQDNSPIDEKPLIPPPVSSGNAPYGTMEMPGGMQNYPQHMATDPTAMDAMTVEAAYRAPRALIGLARAGYRGGMSAIDYLMNLAKNYRGAEALSPTETALQTGLGAKDALTAEKAAETATRTAKYAAVPQDVKISLPNLRSQAENIMNEIKDVPDVNLTPRIKNLASAYMNMGDKSLGTINTIQSDLKDMAVNGSGAEKAYAYRLGKAIDSDLEAYGKQTPPSQEPTLAAGDLRHGWADITDQQRGYSSIPDVIQRGQYLDPSGDAFAKAGINPAQDALNKVADARNYAREQYQLQGTKMARQLSNAKPEDMADIIFKGGRVDDVNTAKALMGDSPMSMAIFKNLQGHFYDDLANSKDIGKAMGKYDPEFLKTALTPQHLNALKAIDTIKKLGKTASYAGKSALVAGGLGGAVAMGERLVGR